MPVENNNFAPGRARKFFQADAQIQFFRRVKFMAKPADLTERRRFDKNKRASHEPRKPAGVIPKMGDEAGDKKSFIEPNGNAARQNFAAGDFFGHVGK